MSVGNFVQKYLIAPAFSYLSQPENREKVTALLRPIMAELLADAVGSIESKVESSATNVVETVGQRLDSSSKSLAQNITTMGSSITTDFNSVTGSIAGLLAAIRKVIPFGLGDTP